MDQRKILGSCIPFGFKRCEDNPKYMEPIPKEQELITRARELRLTGTATLRDLVAWIESNTGRRLTPRGIDKVIHREY